MANANCPYSPTRLLCVELNHSGCYLLFAVPFTHHYYYRQWNGCSKDLWTAGGLVAAIAHRPEAGDSGHFDSGCQRGDGCSSVVDRKFFVGGFVGCSYLVFRSMASVNCREFERFSSSCCLECYCFHLNYYSLLDFNLERHVRHSCL